MRVHGGPRGAIALIAGVGPAHERETELVGPTRPTHAPPRLQRSDVRWAHMRI